MKLNGVLETCLYVDDLAAAEQFYGSVLGLPVVGRQVGRHVFFRCGDQMLLIFDPRGVGRADSETPGHGAHGMSHIAFRVNLEDLDAWRRHLTNHHVAIEKVVDWPQGGQSVYFRDPAGNSLELAPTMIWNGADSVPETVV
jgi:catechol 2,3-dioxygenase-like lactoylglutathione lyase family enzyme